MNLLQMDEITEWEETTEEIQQRFEIDSLESLNWAFRKLSAIHSKEADIAALAKKERERIDFWEAEQKKALENDKTFFETLIQTYHQKQLEADPKAKTLSTPYGKSKSRVSKASPDKSNEEALLQHIKENEMTEYIKESVKWGDLKKTLKVVDVAGKQVVVDETGQIIQGCIVKPASITFSCEVE